ncbi:magnesium transporter [Anaerococcus sp. mt242]|uniref:magnesium transporter n=1 Tax=Anaerococcus sp. mt242 TaxID=2661917 RepID=UPI0019318C19|nr:magnesium transporter [Anaerococcus sp. mt242]MBM0046476.1 magnesium transporter [Anaerococcus sp. mt242]
MDQYKSSEERKAELSYLLEHKNLTELSELLSRTNPVDIVDFIEELSSEEALVLYRLLKKEDAVEVFAELDQDDKEKLQEGLNDDEFKELLDELNFDDMIDTLEEMPATMVQEILKTSDNETRDLVNEYLQFPEDSAGTLMTTEFVEVRADMTVGETLAMLEEVGKDKVTVYTCYVTDETHKLLGYVSLRMIVTRDLDTKISELMFEDVIYVYTTDDQEDVAHTFQKYGFTALPVVDNTNRLVGIITVDDIMWIIEQEDTEDFQRIAGTTPDEADYSKTSAWALAKNRIPWLMFLMISGAFTSTILKRYEDVIQTVIALNMFIPMLTGSGGNAGSQASTLVIRAMATHDIEPSDWSKVVVKEIIVGLICGLALGLVAFLKCYFFDKVAMNVALVVAFTILAIVVLAKAIGSLLPIVAEKLGADPAIMASPLITTIVDSLGLIVYFNIAQAILPGLNI